MRICDRGNSNQKWEKSYLWEWCDTAMGNTAGGAIPSMEMAETKDDIALRNLTML